jgi:periplasmic protein TonB
MTTATWNRTRSLDWLRVGAWSGSFAAHTGVLLLLLLPMTVPLTRPPVTTIVARWIETPPPPPMPPEPSPPATPHHARAAPVHAHPPIPAIAPSDVPTPVPVADTTNAPEAAGTPSSPPTGDVGSGSATQALAYATQLHPAYPPASMHAHEQGVVLLRVLVDKDGIPQRVEIARSSGHARLDTAARDSVLRARFRPVMRNGEAAAEWGIVPIEFRLDRG